MNIKKYTVSHIKRKKHLNEKDKRFVELFVAKECSTTAYAQYYKEFYPNKPMPSKASLQSSGARKKAILKHHIEQMLNSEYRFESDSSLSTTFSTIGIKEEVERMKEEVEKIKEEAQEMQERKEAQEVERMKEEVERMKEEVEKAKKEAQEVQVKKEVLKAVHNDNATADLGVIAKNPVLFGELMRAGAINLLYQKVELEVVNGKKIVKTAIPNEYRWFKHEKLVLSLIQATDLSKEMFKYVSEKENNSTPSVANQVNINVSK